MKIGIFRLASVLVAAGVFVAGVLSARDLLGVVVPCGESDPCLAASQSPLARIGGVPLSLGGLAYYATLAVLAFVGSGGGAKALAAWRALRGIVVLGSFVSFGLMAYSAIHLHAFCSWCSASASITFALLFVVTSARVPFDDPASRMLLPAMIAWAVLAVWTFVATGPKDMAPSVDGAALARLSPSEIAPEDSPSEGSSRDRLVVTFADLECPATRRLLPSLRRAAQDAGARFVLRHFPLSSHPRAMEAAVLAAQEAPGMAGVDAWLAAPAAKSRAPSPTPQVVRDLRLARRIGIHASPTVIVVTPLQGPRVVAPTRVSREATGP